MTGPLHSQPYRLLRFSVEIIYYEFEQDNHHILHLMTYRVETWKFNVELLLLQTFLSQILQKNISIVVSTRNIQFHYVMRAQTRG